MIKPFLKWPGGKQWLVREYGLGFINYKTYIEPFLGGGALFWSTKPRMAILSDSNTRLISLYKVVRDYPKDFSILMEEHHRQHSKAYYYQLRDAEFEDEISRAAQFLYLNRTCFNGIYRVNRFGKFNVPIGTKTSVVFPGEDFERYATALKTVRLENQDFETSIDMARAGDLVFADPPYTVKHNMNGFVRYNENLFSWDDQIRLMHSAVSAAARGATVIISNADHVSLRELYRYRAHVITLERKSVLSGKLDGRKGTTECLYIFLPAQRDVWDYLQVTNFSRLGVFYEGRA